MTIEDMANKIIGIIGRQAILDYMPIDDMSDLDMEEVKIYLIPTSAEFELAGRDIMDMTIPFSLVYAAPSSKENAGNHVAAVMEMAKRLAKTKTDGLNIKVLPFDLFDMGLLKDTGLFRSEIKIETTGSYFV